MAGAGHHPDEKAEHGNTAPPTAAAGPRVVRHLRSGLTVRTSEIGTGGAVRVNVRGEIDVDCAGTLYDVLADCLANAPRGVEVDLTGADFFDCAGLNALLRARRYARDVGARLTVSSVSPAVARVLDLTQCRAFQQATVPDCALPRPAALRPATPASARPA